MEGLELLQRRLKRAQQDVVRRRRVGAGRLGATRLLREVLERQRVDVRVPPELGLGLRIHLDGVDDGDCARVRAREEDRKLLEAEHRLGGRKRQVVPAALPLLRRDGARKERNRRGDVLRQHVAHQDAHAHRDRVGVGVVDEHVERALVDTRHVVLRVAREARLGRGRVRVLQHVATKGDVVLLRHALSALEIVDREARRLRARALGQRGRQRRMQPTLATATACAACCTAALVAVERAVLGNEPAGVGVPAGLGGLE